MSDPLFIVLDERGLSRCIFAKVRNSGGLRTDCIVGDGTRPDLLCQGEPFLIRATALETDAPKAERQVATSPIVRIVTESQEPLTILLTTERGSIYRVIYTRVEGSEQ